MANMKLIIALFASLAFASAMPMADPERMDALERRAEALEVRAEQLQDMAAVYRRALSSFDDIEELVERGQSGSSSRPKLNIYCDRSVPSRYRDRAIEKVQKMYGKDRNLHKFKNGEIFVAGHQEVPRTVTVALYNGSRRPISAPTVSVSLGI